MSKRLWIVTALLAVMIGVMCCYTSAVAAGGTYDGIDWDLTDGVLTLGKEGETQTLENRRSRSSTDWPWHGQSLTITSVVTNGNLVLQGSIRGMFYYCSILTSLDVSNFNTSNVTDMSSMFSWCSSLLSLDVTGFNTSNVKDMSNMFYNCQVLTSLDVSGWNTGNVTNMREMFYLCSDLTSLDVSNWNTSNVTNMRNMFYHCSGLTSLDVSGFNTSKVTAMNGIFEGCSGLTSLDVSNFDTSNLTDMSWIFAGCRGLTSLNVSGWDTDNVTDMSNMFYLCSGLTSLDVTGFNTSKVTDMHGMFQGCSVKSLDLSRFDTSNVTNMSKMFQNCDLTSLDITGFNTSKVTDMSDMFLGCNKLAAVSLGNKYKTVSSRTILLPSPQSLLNGISYTGKWIREDGLYGPFRPSELRSNYNNETMPGKWIWEPKPTDYTLRFSSASYPGAVGEMAQVTTSAKADYQLAANQYGLFGFVFDHWDDGNGHTYADEAIIPANTYRVGDVITLNLVMKRRDTSITMRDGKFEFSIQGGETALFDNMPANTVYQVYEQTPNGWNLIAQSDASGTVIPLETAKASFGNEYNPMKVVVRIAGTKLMSNGPADADAFTFMLYEDDTLVDIVKNKDGGLIEFSPITYTASGVHHYTVREASGGDVGVIYDTHEEEITVTVESDDEGNLSCDIQTDTDGILFKNDKKPGYLKLTKKGSAGHEDSEAGFVFDIQFTYPDGRPYDLVVSTLDYVDSENVTWDLPDVGIPEKVKYTLTVAYQRLNMDGTVKSEETSSYEYYAGDVFELNDLGDITYRYQTTVGLPVMRVGNVFRGVMGNGDSRVEIRYEPMRMATIDKTKWENSVNNSASSSSLPLRTASSFRQNTSYTSIDDLPLDAVRIDNEATACSIYFWSDGDNAYWWSDAEIVYLPANASNMFYNCSSLTSLNLSRFDTSNVTNMYEMFDGCNSLTFVDLSGFDTSHVTGMRYMFHNCSSLTSLDVSGFDTSNVQDMEGMFYRCIGLTSLDVSGWDTSKGTDMDYMFNGCSGLTSLNLSNFNTSNVMSMQSMFSGCSSLTSLNVSGWNTSNVTTMASMFYNCTGLTSLDVSGFDTAKVTSVQRMFYECKGLTSLDVSGFDTSNVTDMASMFYHCTGLTSLDVSGFNTSNVTSMSYMFENCGGLTSLGVSGWNTSKVTTIRQMFVGCSGLTSLDLSGWNTQNVTDMASIVARCTGLTSLDLSGFDTSKVTDMSGMFASCSNLTLLDLSGFDTSNVTSMNSMYYGCSSWKEVILGTNNVFKGKGSTTATLPWIPSSKDGVTYTQKWIRDDGTFGPFTSTELINNYTSEMQGKWIWEVQQ